MSQSHDIIAINRLELNAYVGCYKEEQEARQPLFATIELACGTKKAGRSDDLSMTIDYDALVQIVKSEIESRRFNLIEAVAETVADICLGIPKVERAQVKIEKPNALRNAASASVIITRDRQ